MLTVMPKNAYVIEMEWRGNRRPIETWTIESERDARLWFGQLSIAAERQGLCRIELRGPHGTYLQTLVP